MIPTWPDKNREDARMVALYQQRGVPADHILFLKNEQCTKAALVKQFQSFLKKPQAGDTLIFYYAGHGDRHYDSPQRPVFFVTYDVKNEWGVAEILGAIESNFKGSNLILTADCCYSGGLSEAMAKRHEPFNVAVFTSAQPTSESTGNWTFTTCLPKWISTSSVSTVLRHSQRGRLL